MPSRCFATPVTQATVWGIDDGWGVAAPTTDFVPVDLDEGRYTATISIAPRWTRELGVAAADRRVSFGLSVADSAFSRPAAAARTKDAPDTTLDDGGGVPDLVALPPWQVDARVDARTGADLVMFASTIWNAGTGPLVVDGSRRAGAPTMTAYQSFYEDGAAVRRTRAGSFQFHDAAGHQHWHFLDFAQYSLVDRTTDARVRSEKESFCLTWTDPVDLTIPEAAWDPGSTSLQTACGTPESLSLRQLIPVGWGDTYHQQLAGQAFDVTDLPNGRYAIEVATNVDGRLTELRTDNNAASVEIELGGGRGARTVTVRDR